MQADSVHDFCKLRRSSAISFQSVTNEMQTASSGSLGSSLTSLAPVRVRRKWAESAGWPNGSKRADRRRPCATPKARTPSITLAPSRLACALRFVAAQRRRLSWPRPIEKFAAAFPFPASLQHAGSGSGGREVRSARLPSCAILPSRPAPSPAGARSGCQGWPACRATASAARTRP